MYAFIIMMPKLSSTFYRISSGAFTLVSLLIFVLFMIFVLPAQAQRAKETSAGIGSPDTSFFYTTDNLYEMAEAYGADGRAAYIRSRLTFDLIFPLTYLFFLVTSISWIAQRAIPNVDSRWRLINLFPFFGFLFDYFENIATSIVMFNFPQPTPVLGFLAPILSLTKWFFVNGSFVVLFILGMIIVWRRISERNIK